MKEFLYAVALAVILGIASGCIPRRYGHFINSTSTAIALSVDAGHVGKQSRTIHPSAQQRFYLPSVDNIIVTAKNEDGVFFHFKISLAPDDPQFLHGKLLNFRTFLVTENGVFPVRAEFVDDWQKHKAKITNPENGVNPKY
jgi:hypothetical protein